MKDIGYFHAGGVKKKKKKDLGINGNTNLGVNIGFPKALHKGGITAGYRGAARRP